MKKFLRKDSTLDRGEAENFAIPVWLHATESFYKKLNQVAQQCGLARYEALSEVSMP